MLYTLISISFNKRRTNKKVPSLLPLKGLIEEPGSSYFGHVTLNQSRAIDIANGITDFIRNYNVDLEKIIVIGCDGTNVNTGWKGGAIRLIEIQANKSLKWSICLLHANELPLRHLLQKLDGDTKGPYPYSGPIESLLSHCEKMPVVQFKPVLPLVNEYDLNTDQKYLHQITKAIGDGVVPHNLAEKNPGKMGHSRWLTTANRVLRLYVATNNPSQNLILLAEFVIKLNSRMWFEIKTQPQLENGASHLWKLMFRKNFQIM